MAKVSRGIRNNNPLNIRKGSMWLGLSVFSDEFDNDFCVFTNVLYGLRAAMYLMTKYVFFYDKKNIEQIINRWAPPSDGNDTKVYISCVVGYWQSYVNKMQDVFPYNGYFEVQTDTDLFYLLKAMCKIESNYVLSYT